MAESTKLAKPSPFARRNDPTRWTTKQRRFVEEYMVDFNATAAARRAGYSASRPGLAITATNLMSRPNIRAAIDERLEALSMSAAEAVDRLSDWARGSMADVVSIDGRGHWQLDLNKAREGGKLHLIQELSYDGNGQPRVKLYSAMDAVIQVAKMRGLFRNEAPVSVEVAVTVTRRVVRADDRFDD